MTAVKAARRRPIRVKLDSRDRWFHLVNYVLLGLCILIIAIPLLHVISQSLSSPSDVLNGRVTFLPVNFTASTYGYVLRDKNIMSGYKNSLYYMTVGTLISVTLTILAAYPLARRDLFGRKALLFLFTFTMLFGGGMIPTYLIVRQLKLIDSIWALVLPNAINAYNIIIARTFFQTSIPTELYEAAEIDGASDTLVFFRVVMPLSASIVAVMVLFNAISLWNVYFDALIYLNTSSKYPLQMVLRNIMMSAQVQSAMVEATGKVASAEMLALTEALKYTTIVCASLPVLALYPFIQKHFTKGIMIGTLKG
ncbi:MAG: carbohydrate ABC transporter permease [Oscillospiraceae bacterium]|jgi:ABC-type glycerol-3-phosphate transport system permease component|nr:carbohydrate ABC transporter permease [Oscillospiraceae bacterium]